jgi:glyoxylase-like metal-dependent hydrolase (beta-lactamase superfamily II)
VQSHNSGIHHIRVGDIIVSALADGMLQASLDWVAGVDAQTCETLSREGFRVIPPRITISAFLLDVAGKPVLVDTGCGDAMGPEFGHVRRRLDVLGVSPGDIGTILLTHAHIDHVCGLIDADGAPFFPNAELFIHRTEPEFWFDAAQQTQAPEARRDAFATAQRCLTPYMARLRKIEDGAEALPGISALLLPGHTPGHCGWVIESRGEKLLIWGDLVHLPAIQFPRPDAGMTFDTDPAQGQASRLRAFGMAADERLLVAGMHLDFPAFGHVVRNGKGFGFVPELWLPAA